MYPVLFIIPNTANQFPGVVIAILLLSFITALPLSYLVIFKYKGSLIKGMGYSSVKFVVPVETIEKTEQELFVEPRFNIINASQLPKDTSPIYLKLKETLGYHWFVYGAMCLVFASINAWCILHQFETIGIWQFLYIGLVFFFPFLPVSFMLLANGMKQRLIIGAILGFLFITSTYIIWASAATNGMTFSSSLLPMLLYNIIPVCIISIFRLETIKALGLFIYSFFIICFSGPALFSFYLITNPESMEAIGYKFIDMGFSATTTLISWAAISILIAGLVGWFLFKKIKNLYLQKKLNDIQLNADAVMLLFNITYSLFISFDSTTYALVSLLAFPVYKITGYILFYFLRQRKVKAISPRLLILRVFALGDDSKNLFERILKHWRYAGSIQMISGPDLATTNLEPHEVISFVSGQLKNSYCEDSESIEKNISNADILPDLDGTHRVNEFFCRDNNWKEVLKKLVKNSEVVLMDLRKFSEKFKGCKYEIEALAKLVSFKKLIFIIDETTVISFTKEVFTNAFCMAGKGSINITEQQPVNLYKIDKNKDMDALKILNLLCSKID